MVHMGQERENNGVDMENQRVLREHDLQMVSNIYIYTVHMLTRAVYIVLCSCS